MTFDPSRLAVIAGLMLGSISVSVSAEEVQKFNAFAWLEGGGVIVRAGTKAAQIAGSGEGPFFVESGDGPLHAGRATCTIAAQVELDTAKQAASGACVFNAVDGATAWGSWECQGYNLVGCRGTFKLTGGSGRFEGVTGESAVLWRPSAHELSKTLDGSAKQATLGTMSWRDLTLKKAP